MNYFLSISIFCFWLVGKSLTSFGQEINPSGVRVGFVPQFGIGLTIRHPQTVALEGSYKPMHWLETKINMGSSTKIGYDDNGRNQGAFVGLGLAVSNADRWQTKGETTNMVWFLDVYMVSGKWIIGLQ
jgi:hypothetical protein